MTVSNVTGRQLKGQRLKKDPGPPDKLQTNLLFSQNKTNEQASRICNFLIQVKKLRKIKKLKLQHKLFYIAGIILLTKWQN